MHAYTQNGEEDTVLRDDLKRVKKKLSLTFAIAIIGTCVVFGLLYYLGIDLLNNYIEGTSHLIYYNEKPYIDEFQQYVSDNDISTTDVEQYDEWMSEHDVSFYSIQEEGKVIYNKSNVDKLISPAKNMYDYRFICIRYINHFQHIYHYPFEFNSFFAFSSTVVTTGSTINAIQLTNEIINRIIMFFRVKKALISIRTSNP